nr:immunoglobulin heavy chain junction region [Macaca mulatta]
CVRVRGVTIHYFDFW